VIHIHVPNGGTGLLGDPPPGKEVRCVFGYRQEQLITRTKPWASPGTGDEVYALGGSSHPDHLIWGLGIDEGGERMARRLEALICSPGEGMERIAGIGVVASIVVQQCFEHLLRALCSRRAVQVGEGIAVYRLVQCREVRVPMCRVGR